MINLNTLLCDTGHLKVTSFKFESLLCKHNTCILMCVQISNRETWFLPSQVVISAVMPHYLCHIKMQTRSATLVDEENEGQEMMFKEIRQLRFLLNYLKVIIENSKHLGRWVALPIFSTFNESLFS